MSLGERMELAHQALAQGPAPLPIVLRALDIPRATWYYYLSQKPLADQKREEEDRKAREHIEAILLEHLEYGYRRLDEALRRRGIVINAKRIRRLLKDFGLGLKRKARKPKPNPLVAIVVQAGERADLRASLLKEREPELFELLYTDFTLLPYAGGKGRAWFLVILDHQSRGVLAWTLSPSPSAESALEAWERAKGFIAERLEAPPKVLMHHDQGVRF